MTTFDQTALKNWDGAAFFDQARTDLFGGTLSQLQVDGINAILAAWATDGDGDKRKLAYVLATAKHETANTMRPVTEYGSDAYLRAKPYWPFVGRGFAQLTWRDNYAKASSKLGLPMLLSSPPQAYLVAHPEKALEPGIAAKILVRGMSEGWFTGKKLSDYIGVGCDFVKARAIVNGSDRAALIAIYANAFLRALSKVGVPKATPTAPAQPFPPLPRPAPIPTPAAPPRPSLWAAIIALFKRKL